MTQSPNVQRRPQGPAARSAAARPAGATGALILADGTVMWGQGFGAKGHAVGEVVFNTAMSGYQEVLTDPSYAAQIITFTFPHIGNVGTNAEDLESLTPYARGLVVRAPVTAPSNWRSTQPLPGWLEAHGVVGLAGLDTRALTRRIRDAGAPAGIIVHDPDGAMVLDQLLSEAQGWPGLEGMDLTPEVSRAQTDLWDQTLWRLGEGYGTQTEPSFHVAAIDYGAKRNILRHLAESGCKVTVVPATASAESILSLKPDGVFLSNGPGDPAATAIHAVPTIKALLDSGLPLFGICLGHQLLALALGAKTRKMAIGHRGANHPVKDLKTGQVEITSQNHGFVVDADSLPDGVDVTHISLFDNSVEGLRMRGRPVFSVQYHPEASPGPTDSAYLFERFVDLMSEAADA